MGKNNFIDFQKRNQNMIRNVFYPISFLIYCTTMVLDYNYWTRKVEGYSDEERKEAVLSTSCKMTTWGLYCNFVYYLASVLVLLTGLFAFRKKSMTSDSTMTLLTTAENLSQQTDTTRQI